ncbi:MAG TPA: hypothetical protein VFO71_00450, partial [Gemmatimonadales bacterium]|nr:hypothetical protein [Gemmatimonadales bacterium]
MAIPQGGEPKRTVRAGVLVIADPDAGTIEQLYHRGQDLVTREPRPAEVALHPLADAGKNLGECQDTAELGLVPRLSPFRVIPVLFPASRIPAGCLDVAAGRGADPHVGVGRRNGQRPDS